MISFNSQHRRVQIVGDDTPAIGSVFYLRSGARARLVDRSGSMVIIEIEKRRSDWIEWSEVKARIGWNDLLRPAALSDESYFTILGAIGEAIYESSN